VGKRAYGRSALSIAAPCLKGFYLRQVPHGVNDKLGKKPDQSRLPSRVDKRRSFLGHVKSSLPTNPLASKGHTAGIRRCSGTGRGSRRW
jgi:hypothetical protein